VSFCKEGIRSEFGIGFDIKRVFFLLFWLLIPTIFLSAQTKSVTPRQIILSGNTGNNRTTMYLLQSGKNFEGYIWFDQIPWPMPILFNASFKNSSDSLQLDAATSFFSIVFRGVMHDTFYSGTAEKKYNNKSSEKVYFELNRTADTNFLPFEFYWSSSTGKLPPQLKNESSASFTISTIWPKGKSVLDATLIEIIRKELDIPSRLSMPEKWLKESTQKFLTTWQKDNGKLSPKDAATFGMSLSEEEDNEILVFYESKRYITLAHYNFSYTGGAHGNYGTHLITINKKKAKTVRLNDVVGNKGIQLLPGLLEESARSQFQIHNNSPLEKNDFFVKKIEPSKDFYVTNSGIGFLYPPYALLPFAYGEVDLFIPFGKLSPYLQKSFVKTERE
jgi:Protein of unknown function (DUF3298)